MNAARLSTQEKVALFRRLFRGRTDVYPVRWESKTGKSGYSPACANEWRPGICEKPRIKCSDCGHRLLVPLTDQTIYDHLAGRHAVGVYPLLADDTCHLLAVDFDDADWRNDVQAFAGSSRELGVPVVLEISRSGNGAHAWLFFSSNVRARDARRLGTAIISHTCARNRQLKLTSYDRLFPNQDTMPKGGFGNLIALPLQKIPRESGRSVFVDGGLRPYPDQWALLASVQAMAPHDIEPTILRATGGSHPLALARARNKPKLLQNAACMKEGLSVREAAEKLGVNRNTAFRLRHLMMPELEKHQPPDLQGITEVDEMYFRKSYKGQKKACRDRRTSAECPLASAASRPTRLPSRRRGPVAPRPASSKSCQGRRTPATSRRPLDRNCVRTRFW